MRPDKLAGCGRLEWVFLTYILAMHPSYTRLLWIVLAASLLGACAAVEPPRYGNYSGLAAIGSEPPPPTPATGPNADACDVAQPTGICWYPASAKFHPDGERLIVNLCSNRHGAAYYCRMVEYQIKTQRWSLVPGQAGRQELSLSGLFQRRAIAGVCGRRLCQPLVPGRHRHGAADHPAVCRPQPGRPPATAPCSA